MIAESYDGGPKNPQLFSPGRKVYGAAYLELAQCRKLPLATLDVDLIKAGRVLGMTLLGT